MREAMASAEVGDDVFGDDPTVNRLEVMVAELLGKQAAVFVPSGTQSNLCGLMAHCERGDEYIVSQAAHTYKYEGGGAAVLGSIQPQPIEPLSDGTMSLAKIEAAIKPIDNHFARTKLVCLENTTGGLPLPLGYVDSVAELARSRGLAIHLDGARMFNACAALDTDVRTLAAPFDSVSMCLSKGLGAPAGSVLSGSEELIERARRWRKVLGGTMRQVGILAAGGIWALENAVDRLPDDHSNAARLAEGLAGIDALSEPQAATNMVFAQVPCGAHTDLVSFMADRGVILYAPSENLRLVTHRDISAADVERVVALFTEFFRDDSPK
jgi:threonine aldolase